MNAVKKGECFAPHLFLCLKKRCRKLRIFASEKCLPTRKVIWSRAVSELKNLLLMVWIDRDMLGYSIVWRIINKCWLQIFKIGSKNDQKWRFLIFSLFFMIKGILCLNKWAIQRKTMIISRWDCRWTFFVELNNGQISLFLILWLIIQNGIKSNHFKWNANQA